jgi:hypothetical protein
MDEPLNTIDEHLFFKLAKRHNLSCQYSSICTVFLPPESQLRCYEFDPTLDFVCIFNMHTCSSYVELTNKSSVMQFSSCARIFFTAYHFDEMWYVANTMVIQSDMKSENMVIHRISDILPSIRVMNIQSFPLEVLSLQEYVVCLHFAADDNQKSRMCGSTIEYAFRRSDDKTLLTNGKAIVSSFENSIKVCVPLVRDEVKTDFWIQVVDNYTNIPQIAWIRPHCMNIHPNLSCQKEPTIFEILPMKAKSHERVWIHGQNFEPCITSIAFGDLQAVIYDCSHNLIKCIVPDLRDSSNVKIQVANGNIYTTFSKDFAVEG